MALAPDLEQQRYPFAGRAAQRYIGGGGGMARKPGTTGPETRERILDVATPLFSEHGFAGTSTRMVADAARINVATLAYHFGDKEGLYSEVVQRLHRDLAATIPITMPAGTPAESLRAILNTAWQFAKQRRTLVRLLLRHVLDQGAHPKVVAERWTNDLFDKGDQLILWFRPDLDPVQRRLVIWSLQHLIVRFVIEDESQLRQSIGNPADLDAAVIDFLYLQTAAVLRL
jgi:AcrR family transcriptional regulator